MKAIITLAVLLFVLAPLSFCQNDVEIVDDGRPDTIIVDNNEPDTVVVDEGPDTVMVPDTTPDTVVVRDDEPETNVVVTEDDDDPDAVVVPGFESFFAAMGLLAALRAMRRRA